MTNSTTYSLSFTTGALLHQESLKVATLFQEVKNWNTVRERVLTENLLQARTQNTLKRVYREIASRLKMLSEAELALLVASTPREQSYLLWAAICRRYRFIGDFAQEVVRERFLSLTTTLTHAEFDAFFNRKAEWHEELEQITLTTQKKLRQVLFKMLREANLLTRHDQIIPADLSAQLLQIVEQTEPTSLHFFPTRQAEQMRMP